ncbi:T9SS type A sorting domain-containing protein [candidate division KSB1 bacterium]|nr:T9SS type A sorting domain-containing protein [candidate division KSB1 bacterium]
MKQFLTFWFFSVLMFAVVVSAQDDTIPDPVSFYDFEEGEGLTVVDQGTAANNGEIVGDWIDRTEGGIFTKEGDGKGCLEWTEENAMGELAYVYVPYQEFMNSPDYTLSTWMMYNGTPNWGYLFWADGDIWEPDLADRHIDVWLNPNKGEGGGVDCIMHLEEGGELRVATDANELGIGVMDGDWHQVTVTLEDNSIFSIYVDGLFAVDGVAESDIVTNIGDDMYLGARPNNPDATTAVKIVGWMDRVRIWDSVLNPEQIEYLFKMEGPDGGSVIVEKQVEVPKQFALSANYPNPFNPVTTIDYSLDISESITIEVLNVLGHNISTLVSGVKQAGKHTVQWNGTDAEGNPVASGVYLYRMSSDSRIEARKMMLLK